MNSTTPTFDPAALTGADQELWKALTDPDVWEQAHDEVADGYDDNEVTRADIIARLDAFQARNKYSAETSARRLIEEFYPMIFGAPEPVRFAWEQEPSDGSDMSSAAHRMRFVSPIGVGFIALTVYVDIETLTTTLPGVGEVTPWHMDGSQAAFVYAHALKPHLDRLYRDTLYVRSCVTGR